MKITTRTVVDGRGPADADVYNAWLDEAERRYQEIAEGKVKTIPAKQFFAKLRVRLKRLGARSTPRRGSWETDR